MTGRMYYDLGKALKLLKVAINNHKGLIIERLRIPKAECNYNITSQSIKLSSYYY